MWLITSNSFVSIVEDLDDPNMVFVRGRRESDVFDICKHHEPIIETPEADYPYRCHISKLDLADLVSAAILNIDYSNFKNSVEDFDLKRFATEVWISGRRNLDSRM